MKKIYFVILAAALGTSALTSCIDEVEPQTNVVTLRQASDAPGSFNNFVNSITSTLVGQFYYNGSSHSVYDYGYPSFFLTRDVEGMDVVPVGTNNWYSTWYSSVSYLSPRYAVTQLPWTWYWMWIKNCNTVISMYKASPSEAKESGVGIAYAMRAMFLLDLQRMMAIAPYSVDPNALSTVIVDENSGSTDIMHNPRKTNKEALEFILNDLDQAENYLKNYQRADVYTPNIDVVYGLKARAYLEMQDWANAEKYAKQARQNYSIMDEAAYTDRATGFNSPNSSWIFGVTFLPTDPVILENDGDSSWGSVMCLENGFDCGYAANYGGLNVIDRHLYETIPATDFRKKVFVDFAIDDLATRDEKIEALKAYSNYPERLLASVNSAKYGPGGMSLKFRNAAGKEDVKYDAWVVAVPLMRAEEMALIEAEAAGMQDLGRGQALLEAFAKTRDANYTYGQHNETYGNSKTSAFQNEIWWQRRVELWGEGFATFDVKRYNKRVIRSYPGTNHPEGARWNSDLNNENGTYYANWMNWCFVGTEADYNYDLVPNPNPVQPTEDSPAYDF